jgi:riboflavin synthase
MFTGIVEATADVYTNSGSKFIIHRPKKFDDVCIGSSMCVAGVCLTVIHIDDHSLTFDVVPETLSRTTLGTKKKEDRVNLERSLRVDGRFEGHVVQGHVEAVGAVSSLSKDGMLTLMYPEYLKKYIVEKGSIAIDGVSLTVAKLEGSHCSIALIPHTLEITTLGTLRDGDMVNIETDIFARYMMNRS